MAFGDFTVVRSTVKRVLNSSGVLAEVAVNTPRLSSTQTERIGVC
jgi:hypothetical protein